MFWKRRFRSASTAENVLSQVCKSGALTVRIGVRPPFVRHNTRAHSAPVPCANACLRSRCGCHAAASLVAFRPYRQKCNLRAVDHIALPLRLRLMQPPSYVGTERVSQILVDQIEIEPLRVEMPTRPAEIGFMIVMVLIADRFQEITI